MVRMCELTSVGDLPRFGFFRLPRGVSRLVVRIFHEGHGAVGGRQGQGKGTARHGMCELAFKVTFLREYL